MARGVAWVVEGGWAWLCHGLTPLTCCPGLNLMSPRKFVYENVISLPKLSLPSQEIKSKERGTQRKERKRVEAERERGGVDFACNYATLTFWPAKRKMLRLKFS